MEVFWPTLINPLFDALQPRRLVEVGCEDGRTTARLVEYCRSCNGTVDVIDPAPQIDASLLRAWQNDPICCFKLHADTSLAVLPRMPHFDVILLDGDHNWYTVFHELRCIEGKLAEGCQPLILLHDVAWPYARRDMYYDPEAIPKEFRQPCRVSGVVPNRSELAAAGFNRGLTHALHEGGPRNGVLTAVEDFLRESATAHFFRAVPAFHGLGILCPDGLLQSKPKLASFLANLDHHLVVGGLFDQLESQRVQLLVDAAGTTSSLQAGADLAALEWTLDALSRSARWRIGDTLVHAARRLLGLPATAQVTDTLREFVDGRRHREALSKSPGHPHNHAT